MKTPEADMPLKKPLDDEVELTGLPGLRTWCRVYFFVFGCFVLSVLLLLALTVIYS
ncbi:MAG TPA: hypothetical protein VNU95_01205 [Candidatus Acidoferrales bacterium]|jgi:hypothetical protein|nr:hypothetical protein [Candidatus Acidoferrales bacterium]